MSDRELTKWFQTKDSFRKFPSVVKKIENVEVSLIDPRDLVAYKKELADQDHLYQLSDVEAVEQYIRENDVFSR